MIKDRRIILEVGGVTDTVYAPCSEAALDANLDAVERQTLGRHGGSGRHLVLRVEEFNERYGTWERTPTRRMVNPG